MQDLIQLRKAFSHIKYFDKDHTYFDTNTGEELISCTSFLSKFNQSFQKDYWLNKKAKEYGISPEELEDSWNTQKIIGTTRGTILHKFLEDLWNNKEYPIQYTKDIHNLDSIQFISYHKSVEKLKEYATNFVTDNDHLIPLKLELVLGDSEIGIGGQMDGFFWDCNEDCNVILDYKTDKTIDLSNKYQNFKKPITHLSQCNMNKYQLQLSIYRYILEKNTDIKIGYSQIVWFNHKNSNYEIFPTNYLKDEVEELFKYVRR